MPNQNFFSFKSLILVDMKKSSRSKREHGDEKKEVQKRHLINLKTRKKSKKMICGDKKNKQHENKNTGDNNSSSSSEMKAESPPSIDKATQTETNNETNHKLTNQTSALLHLCNFPDNKGEDWMQNIDARPLTKQELKAAKEELVTDGAIKHQSSNDEKFQRIQRLYQDKPISGQSIGLFSFVASPGATPDKNGIYGFCKIRGVFPDSVTAGQYAQQLVIDDSAHFIHRVHVGLPFPCVKEDECRFFNPRNCDLVNYNETLQSAMNRAEHHKNMKEAAIKSDMERRRESILNSSKQEVIERDPFDAYLCQLSKLDSIKSSFHGSRRDMEQYKEMFFETTERIGEIVKDVCEKENLTKLEFVEKCKKLYIDTYAKLGSTLETLGPEKFDALLKKAFGEQVFDLEKLNSDNVLAFTNKTVFPS